MIKIDCEKLRLFETVLEIDKDKNFVFVSGFAAMRLK